MFGDGDLGAGIKITLDDQYSQTADRIRQSHEGLAETVTKAGQKAFLFNELRQGLESFAQGLDRVLEPGYKFDAGMHELSAISGVTGEALDLIGTKALALNAKFGGSAADKAESYKLLLSRIGPEIAQVPEALDSMGNSVLTLSKSMSGDAQGSAVALTTSMNIYAGSLKDPILQSQEMIRQMNVMAAAAQVGSAEVPQIAETIKVAGLAAKNSGISFEELNTLIQVMGKGAIYGSEAGTGLRNVLATLGQGEYMPRKAREGLIAAGVDIAKIGDATIPVKDRLVEMSKIQGDAALIGEVFGKENQNSFRVLMEGLPIMDKWTGAVTGTNSATEQANIIMDSWPERISRVHAQIENVAIGFFNATKSFMPFIQMGMQGVLMVANFAPALASLSAVFTGVKVAAASALIPLLPWIAAAAAVAGIFLAARAALNYFQESMLANRYEGGFWGVVTKIGGVISGVIDIFKSWDGETFTLSENMRDYLQNLGILELVVNIGTYAIRFKEFLSGVVSGFGEMWAIVKQVYNAISSAFAPVIAKMREWNLIVGKAESSISSWQTAGKVLAALLGGAILAAIVVVTISLISMAVAWIAATWPILAVIAVLGLVWYAITHAGEAWDWIKLKAGEAADYMVMKFIEFKDWLMGLPASFVQFGVNIVENIISGILGAWDGLKSMLIGLFAELPFGAELMSSFGMGGEAPAVAGAGGNLRISDNNFGGGVGNIGASVAATRGAAAVQPPATVVDKSSKTTESISVQLVMDGDVVSDKMIDRQAMKDSRQ